MNSRNLELSALELGQLIERGKLDPLELTECYFSKIEHSPFGNRIYSNLAKDRAFLEAKFASKRAKNRSRLSKLDGVPISWKDLFDSEGIKTEGGSKLLAGRTPTKDAKVVRQCTNAGIIFLGKTHMSELAFSGLGLNPKTATPPCVHNEHSVPGGSSSGAATSVAFSMAAIGIGSDTGGSVRIPACWNNLVGFKPSYGIISVEGVLPLCNSFDTVGPLCRTVDDACAVFEIMGEYSPKDLTGFRVSRSHFLVPQASSIEQIQPEPQQSFQFILDILKQSGAKITCKFIPKIDDILKLTGTLFGAEAYSSWGLEIEKNLGVLFSRIQERFLAGKKYTGFEYIQAIRKLKSLRTSFYKEVSGFDAILLPTCPNLPPLKKHVESNPEDYVRENLLALRNTRLSNLLNLPALTLPTPTPSTGISVISLPLDDFKVLRVSKAIEKLINNSSH